MPPQLWVFAGSNGAGKTSLVRRYRVAERILVVNPDDIARSISPNFPSDPAQLLRAGKEAARLRHEQIAALRSFAIETTLSGHSELRTMAEARSAGYKVNLIFIGIAGPETSLARVRERVLHGGHDVPTRDIRRRFNRTLANLPSAIASADRSFILENQGKGRPRLLLVIDGDRTIAVARKMPRWLAGVQLGER